jgi:hypothetical protein
MEIDHWAYKNRNYEFIHGMSQTEIPRLKLNFVTYVIWFLLISCNTHEYIGSR